MDQLRAFTELKVFDILLVAVILVISVALIRFIVDTFFKKTNFIEERKEKTIERLIRSLTKYSASICFILYLVSQYVGNFGLNPHEKELSN